MWLCTRQLDMQIQDSMKVKCMKMYTTKMEFVYSMKWNACKCAKQQWNSIILANSKLQWITHNNDRIHSIFFQWKVEWNELCNTATGFIYFDEKCSAIIIIIHNVIERCAWFVVQLIKLIRFFKKVVEKRILAMKIHMFFSNVFCMQMEKRPKLF